MLLVFAWDRNLLVLVFWDGFGEPLEIVVKKGWYVEDLYCAFTVGTSGIILKSHINLMHSPKRPLEQNGAVSVHFVNIYD